MDEMSALELQQSRHKLGKLEWPSLSLGVAVFILCLAGMSPALCPACPKLIMFDGIDIRTEASAKLASYWGAVGVNDFFVANVTMNWQQDVGCDPRQYQKAIHKFRESCA